MIASQSRWRRRNFNYAFSSTLRIYAAYQRASAGEAAGKIGGPQGQAVALPVLPASSETGARNLPRKDRNTENYRPETGIRQRNPRKCRGFSHTGK